MLGSIAVYVRRAAIGSAIVLSAVAVAPQAAAAAPLGTAGLAALRDTLAATAPVGTVTYVDPATDSVVLRVPGRLPASLSRAIGQRSAQVRVEQGAGAMTPVGLPFYGGTPIETMYSERRCTAGFTVKNRTGVPFIITAGHCVKGGTGSTAFWYTTGGFDSGTYVGIGTLSTPSYPGDDYGAISVVPISQITIQPGVLTSGLPLHLDLVRDAAAGRGGFPGSGVCKTGRTSGVTCGHVLATNVSVTYHDGVVGGLVESDACAQPGDSGSPVYSDAPLPYVENGTLVFHPVAYGVMSGSNLTACTDPSRRSLFQPLSEVLAAYQMTLLT